MTTTTLDHLLAAVLASPEDDLPRLVMADALDENDRDGTCPSCNDGDHEGHHKLAFWKKEGCPRCDGSGRESNGFAERAEFIRVGVEKSRLGVCRGYRGEPWPHPGGRCCLSWCEYCRLADRERELLNRHVLTCGSEWFPSHGVPVTLLSERVRMVPTAEYQYVSRGFIEVIAAPLATLIGGEVCPECNGRQGEDRYPEDDPTNRRLEGPHWHDCPACSGTGRTPGILRDVLKCQPVTRVKVVGMPIIYDRMMECVVIHKGPMPEELFCLLYPEASHVRDGYVCFVDESTADAALSAAIIKRAKGVSD